MGEFCIWLATRTTLRYEVKVRAFHLCLSFSCMCFDSADSVDALFMYYSSDLKSDLNLITLPQKWQICIPYLAMQMENLRKHIISIQNIIHNAESHPTNDLALLRYWLNESESFAPWASDCGRHRSVRIPDMQVNISRRVREDPGTSARRTATAEGVSVSLVWRIIPEHSRYPYHIQQLQSFIPPNHCSRVMFSNSFSQNAL
jgi:hypothetical protein